MAIKKKKRRKKPANYKYNSKSLPFLLFVVIATIAVGWYMSEQRGNIHYDLDYDIPWMTVHYIDVGQGDAVLVELPNGQTMMIDGGDTSARSTVMGYLENLNIRKIDYYIMTHYHADHIGVSADIINNLDIGQIFAPRYADNHIPTTRVYQNMIQAMTDKDYRFSRAIAGEYVFTDNEYGLSVMFVAPHADSYTNTNNYSAGIRLVYGSTSFLFTGDAETLSEREMVESPHNIRANVLHAGHHGSSSSNIYEFLRAVSPSLMVISVGADNTYGHPHREVLERADEFGIVVVRTDERGTIRVISDGVGFVVD
jgi:competence protein ComEC